MPPVLPADVLEEGGSDDDAGSHQPAAYHIHDSSDSESEFGDGDANVYSGYELLPQEPETENQGDRMETLNDSPNILDHAPVQSVFDEAFSAPPNEWKPTEDMLKPAEPRRVEPMDDDHIAKIKAAMVQVSLPSSHVPAWANDIPEEEWKKRLYERLQAQPSS
uniref:Male-enhanced antigen 1 n=1 Tax=Ornithodoros turicata TaxID=34597 RepID=A0A2R5LG66_9ACAR